MECNSKNSCINELISKIRGTATIHPVNIFSIARQPGNEGLQKIILTKLFWQIRDSFATDHYKLDLSQKTQLSSYYKKEIRPFFFFEKLILSSTFKLPLKEGLISINHEGLITFGDKEAIYFYDCKSLKENTPFKSMEELDLFNMHPFSKTELITIDADQNCTLWNLRDPFTNTLRITKSLSLLAHISSTDTPAVETAPGCQWIFIGNSYLQAVKLTSDENTPSLTPSIVAWVHVGGATHFIGLNEQEETTLSSEKCSSSCQHHKSVKQTFSSICAVTFGENDQITVVKNTDKSNHLNIEDYADNKLINKYKINLNFKTQFLKSCNANFGSVFVYNTNGNIAKIDANKKELSWSNKLTMSYYKDTISTLEKIELATHMDSKILITSDSLGYLSFFDAEDGSFIKKLDLYYSKEWFVFQEGNRLKILSNERRNEENYLVTYEARSEGKSENFQDLSLPPKPSLSSLTPTLCSVDATPKIPRKRKRNVNNDN